MRLPRRYARDCITSVDADHLSLLNDQNANYIANCGDSLDIVLLRMEKVDERGIRAWDRRRKSVLQGVRDDGDWMRWRLVHSSTGTGREEGIRKGGGEEARSVRAVCDACAAHGDRAAVGIYCTGLFTHAHVSCSWYLNGSMDTVSDVHSRSYSTTA